MSDPTLLIGVPSLLYLAICILNLFGLAPSRSMPRKYYIYNPARPLSWAEEEVRARGYPYVSTTHLAPGESGDHHNPSLIWCLNQHRHSSRNTHFITRGSIQIAKAKDNVFRLRAPIYGVGQWADMPRRAFYRGEAGPDGCDFVEGHQLLSPTTADRFEQRQTIVEVAEGTLGAFTTV